MRYWDSSALIPLVIRQKQSRQAESWMADEPRMVIWTLTPTEITSALWRLVRERELKEEDARSAEEGAQLLAGASYIVADVEGVKRLAQRLLRVHPLRAADALQLAAAIRWIGEPNESATLYTFDERLAGAARREGFSVP